MKNQEYPLKYIIIIILFILTNDNIYLWLYFKEKVHKMHDSNAWNCMLSITIFGSVSSIQLNKITGRNKKSSATLSKCEIEGMMFSRLFLAYATIVNIMPKALEDKFEFRDLYPFMLELQIFTSIRVW